MKVVFEMVHGKEKSAIFFNTHALWREGSTPSRIHSGVFALFLAIIAALGHLSCGTPGLTQNSIRLATLQKGDFSGIHEPLEVVVRTQEEWEKLWKRHAAIANPPPPVDFATEMVAGVFLGDKNTGGYDVEITRAERQGSSLYIYYIEKAPGAEAMVIQVVTQPHHLVRLPRDGASVIFRRESK